MSQVPHDEDEEDEESEVRVGTLAPQLALVVISWTMSQVPHGKEKDQEDEESEARVGTLAPQGALVLISWTKCCRFPVIRAKRTREWSPDWYTSAAGRSSDNFMN